MRVLHVCTEMVPLLKTGGLADVVGALPRAQRGACDARVLLPGLPAIMAGVDQLTQVAPLPARFGVVGARLLHGVLRATDTHVYVIDAPTLYERHGNPYADAGQLAYPDNYLRFAWLGWVAAKMAQALDPMWTPQILHCHDWHAGLAPAYVAAARRATGRALAGTVMTVHNLAYQGTFPASVFGELGLPGDFFGTNGVEFHAQVSYLKAGLYYADRITTVSPTYAREIQGIEQGCGLDGLLRGRARDLHGILNGVDDAVWNPRTDPLLAANYDAQAMHGKAVCKQQFQREHGLDDAPDAPLFCVVTRLAEQKGLHLILAALPEIVGAGGQLALLGSGDAALERAFQEAAVAAPRSIAVTIGYDEALAHRIIAASDVILVPSRFEPCGLTQLYGLKYGAMPLVRRVGGLADTVVDAALENLDDSATGFVFDDFTAPALALAVRRVFALARRPSDWRQVQARGMAQQFGWNDAATQFLALYRGIAP